MSMEKHVNLVRSLSRLTAAGDLDWQDGPLPKSYQVSFATGSVIIRMIDKDTGVAVEIMLVNQSGNIVDSFDDDDLKNAHPTGPWFMEMNQLLDAARRTALGAEKLLDSILKELDEKVTF